MHSLLVSEWHWVWADNIYLSRATRSLSRLKDTFSQKNLTSAECLQDAERREQHGGTAAAAPDHEQTSSSDLEHVEAADAQESCAASSGSDNDFDKYLNELSGSDEEEGKHAKAESTSDDEEHASGEDDLDDYMRVLADEDKKSPQANK